MSKWLAAIGAGLVLGASPAWAQDDAGADDFSLSFSTGADYSVGEYGAAEKTKILVVPFSLRAGVGSSRFTATVPYLRIDSPGGVIIGPDGTPLPGVPGATGIRKGLGDLSLGYSYSLSPAAFGGFEVDLGGRVKLPTSPDRKQLGTGKTDFSLSADVSYPVGLWSPFVTLGYRLPGDPEGVELRNTIALSAGTSFQLGTTVAILSYDYAESSSPIAEDAHELFAAFSGPATSRLNWTVYGVTGLSQGSPDIGAGALLTFKLR
jgi:hypothetical protein